MIGKNFLNRALHDQGPVFSVLNIPVDLYFFAFISGYISSLLSTVYYYFLLFGVLFVIVIFKYHEVLTKRIILLLAVLYLFGILSGNLYYYHIVNKYSDIPREISSDAKITSSISSRKHSYYFTVKFIDGELAGRKCNITSKGSTPRFDENDIIKIKNLQISPLVSAENKLDNFVNGYYYSEKAFIKGKTTTDNIIPTGKRALNICLFSRKIKNNVSGFFRLFLDDNSADFMTSITTGFKNPQNRELYDLLKTDGLSHVAVVSGMHFSIIVSILVILLRRFRAGIKFVSVSAVLFSVIIAFFFGFTPSVTRALIMINCGFIADIFERDKSNSIHLLILSAFIMLLLNPFLIYNSGFVLSFLSVLGIRTLSDRLITNYPLIPEVIRETFAVTLAANIYTFPVVIFFFSEFSTVFLLGNLAVTPFVPYLMVYGYICCILGNFLFGPVKYIIIPLKIILKIIFIIIKAVSTIPSSVIKVEQISLAVVIIYYAAIRVLKTNFKSKKLKYIISAVLLSVFFASCMFSGNSVIGKDKIYVLDGKDSGKIVIYSSNKTIVADLSQNPSNYKINTVLNKKSKSKIDYYFINNEYSLKTLKAISNTYQINNICYPDCIEDSDYLMDELKSTNANMIKTEYNKSIKIGNILLTPIGDKNYNIKEIMIKSDKKTFILSDDMENGLRPDCYNILTYNKYMYLTNNNELVKDDKFQILNDLNDDIKTETL